MLNLKNNHRIAKTLTSSAVIALTLLGVQSAAHADQITVKAGDTLSALAKQYNTTTDQLAKANNVSNVNLITVGQQLNTDGSAQTSTNTQTVIVKAGDTLSGLAAKYGTTVDQIVADNNLGSADAILHIGQQLIINGTAQADNTNTAQTTAQEAYQQTQTPTTQTQSLPASRYGYNQASTGYQGASTAQNSNNYSGYSGSSLSGSEEAAKAWIVARESGGNYNAQNGQYIGKYQLSSSYLNGDYSPANQDRVADQYVKNRYGSWSAAQQHWQANGWY